MTRFERCLARDIPTETVEDYRIRLWQENLAKQVTYSEEEVARMRYFLERDEKFAANKEREASEMKAIIRALAA